MYDVRRTPRRARVPTSRRQYIALKAMPPSMNTSAYRSSTWSKRSPRTDAFPAIFAILPSSASRYELARISTSARPRNPRPPMKKETPAPTAARKATQETTFGFTRSMREATGTRNQSAALRYRSRTIAPVLVPLSQRPYGTSRRRRRGRSRGTVQWQGRLPGGSLSRAPPSDPRGRSTPARRQVSTLEGTVLPRKTGRAEFDGVRGVHLRIPDSTHVPRWSADAARRRGPKHWDHADAVGGPQRTGVLLGTRHQHPLGRWPSNRREDALT